MSGMPEECIAVLHCHVLYFCVLALSLQVSGEGRPTAIDRLPVRGGDAQIGPRQTALWNPMGPNLVFRTLPSPVEHFWIALATCILNEVDKQVSQVVVSSHWLVQLQVIK